jgi:hypothetical protein
MRAWLCGLLLVPTVMGIAAGLAAEASKMCFVELRPYPGSDPAMWDALYAARDGKVYTGLCTEGESAHLYVYDPHTDANTLLFDMAEALGERGKGIRVSGKLHNKPVEDEEGNLYFVPVNNGSGPLNIDFATWQGGRWLKYDPRRNRLEDLGFVDRGVGVYALTIDTKRRRLFGLGFTGYLYRFDLDRRVTTNLGRVSNWDVCRTIVCDDEGNVYGSFPTARVWKYDAKTERVDDLPLRIPFDPAVYPTQLRNPMIDRSCDWRAVTWDPVDRAIYGVTCGSGSILFRLDPHAPVDRAVVALGRLCDTAFLEGRRQDVPYSPLAFALDPRARRVYFVPSARSYSPGTYAETFGSHQPHHLIVYDLARKQRFDCGALQTADGRRVFGCEAASVGPDGTLYLCGQAEVRNPSQATGRAGTVPVALHLILYRPHR